MVYTSRIALSSKREGLETIFLAGSIDLKLNTNWRQDAIKKIGGEVHFFDPTCVNHDQLNDCEMEKHIKWELKALKLVDTIILNFLPDSESPISLVELGLYVATEKLIVVCPEAFYRSRYVRVLCDKYKTPLFKDLDRAIDYYSNTKLKKKKNIK